MPNARSPFYRGWFNDVVNTRLSLMFNDAVAAYIDANGLTVPSGKTLSIAGQTTATGKLALGALETPTIASGVLTVTKSFVNPLPESSTADQVDSIVFGTAAAGDLLLIHVPATNTITFDDANINLAAATRAVAPGGSLLLVYDGTQWSEITFTAATDNA